MDYVNNLCYCYDCDLPNPPDPYIGLPCTNNPFYEVNDYGNYERAYKVNSYIGIVAPKHYGGVNLSYKVCNEYQEVDGCKDGNTYLFGTFIPTEHLNNKSKYLLSHQSHPHPTNIMPPYK